MAGVGVAVVTGAGSGIGRQVAWALLGMGADVVLVGRRRGVLEETAAGAPAGGGRAVPVVADVSEADEVRGVFSLVRERWGRVDVLFNNAGVMPVAAPVEEVSDQAWSEAVQVNVTGAFWCAREAFALMKAQDPRGGRIINNGSISAHVPRPLSVAYTATKHAVTGLTKSLALEGREFGIACGQIDIGNAATEMVAGIAAGAVQADGGRRAEPVFDAAHVGALVRHMVELPLEANVPFVTLMATGMPYMGRG